MDCIINRHPQLMASRADFDSDLQWQTYLIATGQESYVTTPCPYADRNQTGGDHVVDVHSISFGLPESGTVVCEECGWEAHCWFRPGSVKQFDVGPEDEPTMKDVVSLYPDEDYQILTVDELTGQVTSRSQVPLIWEERSTVTSSDGTLEIEYRYHTHTKLPVVGSDGKPYWPV